MDNNSEMLFKEIDLIQGCIGRMSKNSFMLKGWALTIFAGVIAVTKASLLNDLVVLSCCIFVPLCCFWILDAFFLHTEKKYRKMYEWVLKNRKEGNLDFQFDLNPQRFSNDAGCYFRTLFSITLAVFYAIPLLMILIILLFNVISSHI